MAGIELFAWILFIATFAGAMDLVFGVASMQRLSRCPPDGASYPPVSIIVPACNEGLHIAKTIETLLRQRYPAIEIIAINDRSSDETGTILRELEQREDRVKLVEIAELPPDWMGKAHALHRGAELAQGDYLLFTDGDVILDETVISRAVAHMVANGLDHLSLVFKNSAPGLLLNSLILEAGTCLLQMFRPWRAGKKNGSQFMGVGAFNLVKREAYDAIDGHKRIRMHPIDDIMLGKMIKREGLSQECLLGYDLVQVPWYPGVRRMIDGLMKNVLGLINYRLWLLPPLVAGMWCLTIVPLWGAFLAQGVSQLLFTLIVIIRLAVFGAGTRLLGISFWCAVMTLVTSYISLFIVLRAGWVNYRDGGIYWRGTHYPMSKLRKNSPLLP